MFVVLIRSLREIVRSLVIPASAPQYVEELYCQDVYTMSLYCVWGADWVQCIVYCDHRLHYCTCSVYCESKVILLYVKGMVVSHS